MTPAGNDPTHEPDPETPEGFRAFEERVARGFLDSLGRSDSSDGVVAVLASRARGRALACFAAGREPFRVLPLRPEIASRYDGDAAVRWHGDPGDLARCEHAQIGVREAADRTFARATSGDVSAWLLGPPLSDEELAARGDAVVAFAREIAAFADRNFAAILLRRQLDEHRPLRQAMLRALLAPDKTSLLDGLVEALRQRLRFGRVLVALLHKPSNCLRTERSIGFDASFAPMTIPVERAERYAEGKLVDALRTGEIRLVERPEDDWAALHPIVGDRAPDHAMLAPMTSGGRLLGYVYADRPSSLEAFAMPELAAAFAEFAGLAVENFSLRNDAEERAHTDPLTGLYNRRYLDRILALETARVKREGRPLSLVMLDLCDFKKVNDAFGHVFGDSMLRETAWILKNSVRGHDIVVRYGGDEFVVLLAGADETQARLVLDRIESALDERNRGIEDPRMRIVASLGLALANRENADTLLERADKRMYREKNERTKRRMVEALVGMPAAGFEIVDHVVFNLLDGLNHRMPDYSEQNRRVAYIALVLLRARAASPSEIWTVLLGALLRDVGEVSLPSEMLLHPGELSEPERRAVRMHPVVGEELFHGVAHMEDSRPIVRHHHERYDGRRDGVDPGYPDGLAGEEIPVGARIVRIADGVQAMLADRPWREARSREQVLKILADEAGGAFDPDLVSVLLADPSWIDAMKSPSALRALYRDTLAEARAREEGNAEGSSGVARG